MLTHRQKEALLVIDDRIRRSGGVAPSYEEIGDALGIISRSSVHRIIVALEEKGFIRRLPFRQRAIEVIPQGEIPLARLEAAARALHKAMEEHDPEGDPDERWEDLRPTQRKFITACAEAVLKATRGA